MECFACKTIFFTLYYAKKSYGPVYLCKMRVITIKDRVNRLRKLMEKNDLEAMIITKAENIRYLSGFSGGEDGRLLITGNTGYLFTDSRYTEQAGREAPEWTLVEIIPPGVDYIKEAAAGCKGIGFESHHITWEVYQEWARELPDRLAPVNGMVEQLRVKKDNQELEYLRESARISDQVFDQIVDYIKPGLSEGQVANRIGYLLREQGCEGEAFDTIAVAGSNAALPHGRPGDRVIRVGDMVTLDFGGFFQGYAGDMTRTIVMGKADQDLRARYQAVLEAQQLGVSLVRAGMPCVDIDKQVRKALQKFRLDVYFKHGTGHGLGLEIHEQPNVSPRSTTTLETNMVITIEPGIYIPGWGGIRIEDSVIVKERGYEIITHSDKNLLLL